MNGARTPRSAINSSTAAGESRSPKSRGSASARLSSGRAPSTGSRTAGGRWPMQRLSTETAVTQFRRLRRRGLRGWSRRRLGLRLRFRPPSSFRLCGSVGSAVVAFGVGAAVGRTLAAAGGCSHVVIVECHEEPLIFFPEYRLLMYPRRLQGVSDHASRVLTREASVKRPGDVSPLPLKAGTASPSWWPATLLTWGRPAASG